MLRPHFAFFGGKTFIDLVFFPHFGQFILEVNIEKVECTIDKAQKRDARCVSLYQHHHTCLCNTKRSENCYLTILFLKNKKLCIGTIHFLEFVLVCVCMHISFCCTFQGKFVRCV